MSNAAQHHAPKIGVRLPDGGGPISQACESMGSGFRPAGLGGPPIAIEKPPAQTPQGRGRIL